MFCLHAQATERPLTQNCRWHEHDPEELVSSVQTCIEGAVEKFKKDGHSIDSIKAIGVTNQRETTVVWDFKTGEALHNAIVWTDTRTAAIARELKARPGSDKLQDKCGLPISSYPSVTKLLWLLKNEPKVKEVYDRGDLAFGTVDAWLMFKLNGGTEKNVFVSDPTNASRTMFMDIHTLKYNDDLLDFFSYEFDLRKVHLPEIVRSSDPKAFGELATGALKGFPITGCLGDQSAALVGQKGFDPGSAKNTYGKRASVLPSLHLVLTTKALAVSCFITSAQSPSSPSTACSPQWRTTLTVRLCMHSKGALPWRARASSFSCRTWDLVSSRTRLPSLQVQSRTMAGSSL